MTWDRDDTVALEEADQPGSPTPSYATLNLAFGLIVVVGVAAVIRFLPLGASPYPLNDGGLFAHMAKELAANGFLLPAFTTYNNEAIPFAYPPLGLYATALFSQFWGGDTTSAARWLPPLVSTISVLAMYIMSAELLRSRWRGLVAAAAFASIPNSYLWLIVGGGVTRSLGVLLALMALHQGVLMLRRQRLRHVFTTGMLGGLTALAHPQAAVFLGISLLTLWAFHINRGRPAVSVGQLAAAGILGVLVASPWLVAVITAHGFSVLLSAGRTGFNPYVGASQLLALTFADSSVFDLMTALGILGLLLRIARRQWMIPTWLLLTILVDPRAGATYGAIPLSLSVVPILGELVSRMVPSQGTAVSVETSSMGTILKRHPAAAILLALVLFVTLRTASRTAANQGSPLHGLQQDHVVAMTWVREHADVDASFAIVTDRDWESDYLSEWFPVIAQRTSVATVQGSEWRGLTVFTSRLAEYRQLQRCAHRTITCLAAWADGWGAQGAYVFLPKGHLFGTLSPIDCCSALRETLGLSDRYRLVYDGPGASIFAPVGQDGGLLVAPE